MGLFIDGPAITIDDLIAEDSGLLATAQTVGINVTSKLGLAMSEVQSELETLLLRLQTSTTQIGWADSAAEHWAGCGDSGPGAVGKDAGADDGLPRCIVHAAD